MVNIKNINGLLLATYCFVFLISCNNNTVDTDSSDENILSSISDESEISGNKEESSEVTMNIQVGDKSFTAIIEDNLSSEVFIEKLPLAINMSEMNGNEMYYFMDEDIPVDANRPGKVNNGDIMLYGSNCLVVFYKTFNTGYNYTSLGYITDPEGFKDAIDESGGEVIFSLNH